MFTHHEETIKNITEKLKKQEEILAVIVSGSIAHGFATETSDVDLMIVVSEENYNKRMEEGNIHYYEQESCTYESGYIDGKYISLEFIKQVADRGSEPARFAFEGAKITYSKIDYLDELISKVVRYPVESKNENISRFYAQFEAWKWYCEEGIKHENMYLLNHSISNFILFAGRLILAHNEVLYPYHKWFLRVLGRVREKPSGLIEGINLLLKEPIKENILHLYNIVIEFREWRVDNVSWPSTFIKDSELNWMYGNVPIADI